MLNDLDFLTILRSKTKKNVKNKRYSRFVVIKPVIILYVRNLFGIFVNFVIFHKLKKKKTHNTSKQAAKMIGHRCVPRATF